VASEGPVVAPVAEGNIARGTETEAPTASNASSEGSEAAREPGTASEGAKIG
jgi:hypothetical protein